MCYPGPSLRFNISNLCVCVDLLSPCVQCKGPKGITGSDPYQPAGIFYAASHFYIAAQSSNGLRNDTNAGRVGFQLRYLCLNTFRFPGPIPVLTYPVAHEIK